MSYEKSGRIRIILHGESLTATWAVVGQDIELTSKFGVVTTPLGGMASSPAIFASDKLREIALLAKASPRIAPNRARFNVRDA